MNFGLGFLAGLIGGAAMTLILSIARQAGAGALDLELKIGSLVTKDLTSKAWMIGLAIHLLMSGLIGLLYALGFEYVTRKATWLIGVGFGLVHAIIGGLLLSTMRDLNPLMRGGLVRAPGAFASNLGRSSIVWFVMAHLIYGAIVGAVYRVRGRFHFASRLLRTH